MANGLAPRHLMPEESITWDKLKIADWEIAEALKFAPGTHPLKQAMLYLPHSLYEWQSDGIAAACVNHSNVIISTANESGKTSCLIPVFGLGIMAAFPGAQIYSTSGDERQVKEQLFELQLRPQVEKEHMKKAGWKIKTGSEFKVSAPNGSAWLGYVSQRDSTAEGFHGYWRYDEKAKAKRYCPCVYIVDEAKSVGNGVDEAIGRIDPDFRLNLSTPGKESGWFFEGINPETLRADRPEFVKAEFNRYKTPYGVDPDHDYLSDWENTDCDEMFTYRRMVSWDDCAHLHTEKKRIARLNKIKKFGKNSAYVKSMLYGQFQRGEDFSLIYTDEDLELMRKAMSGEFKPIGGEVRAASDTSGGGDEQPMMIRIGTEVVYQERAGCPTGIEHAEYLVKKLKGLKLDPWIFIIDGGGIGAEIANYMEMRLDYAGIKRAQANSGPRFKFEYKDKYTETHFRIKELLSAGVLKLKRNDKLLKQMRCRRFVEMEAGLKIKTEPKGGKYGHRAREKSSPDDLDTLVYLFYDFDWSLLSIYKTEKLEGRNESAPTKMEKEANSLSIKGGQCFKGMRSARGMREKMLAGKRIHNLRIGR